MRGGVCGVSHCSCVTDLVRFPVAVESFIAATFTRGNDYMPKLGHTDSKLLSQQYAMRHKHRHSDPSDSASCLPAR